MFIIIMRTQNPSELSFAPVRFRPSAPYYHKPFIFCFFRYIGQIFRRPHISANRVGNMPTVLALVGGISRRPPSA